MAQTFNPKKCKTCGKEYSPGGPRQEYCSASCKPPKKSGSRTKKSAGQAGEPVLHAKRKEKGKAKTTKPCRALIGLLDKLQELSSTLQHIFDERESASLFLDELLSKAKSGKYDAADLKKRLRELYIRVAHYANASEKASEAELAAIDSEAAKGE
jgi:uncharacterized protein YfcZ (UPF0381/DUF406 family)